MVAEKKRHGWRAALGGGLIALLALGAGQAAHAAPTIDPNETGSITVHKHQQSQDPSTTEGTGLEQTVDLDAHPVLQNIEFTAFPITDVDLTTNEGWQDLAALIDSFDPSAAPEFGIGGSIGAQVGQGRTAADGSLTFDNLPVGAYLVQETDWSAPQDSDRNPIDGGVTPSLPFIMTIPMTHPEDRNTWIYDAHVYPKNAISTVEKTVSDADAVKVGDDIEYTITGDIPPGVVNDAYRIRDNFDPKLAHVATAVYLVQGDTDVELTEGTDYALNVDGQTVDVDITGALSDLQNYAQVRVVHTATVLEAGEIENEPMLFPNDSSITNDTPTTGPPTEIKFGNIVLQKNDENGEALEDAVFSVFLSEDDAREGVNAIEIDDETTFTSDADGIALIEGLRYSNWANGAELDPTDPEYRTYWIAEIEAPEGYELLANPIEVVVDSDSVTAVTETIVNVPKNGGFELPITGGAGSSALVIGGLLLALGGAYLLARRNRVDA